jgi:hypothetical protein
MTVMERQGAPELLSLALLCFAGDVKRCDGVNWDKLA